MPGERDFGDVGAFLARFTAAPAHKRSRVASKAPLERMQEAALNHPDPFVRRSCIGFLDHYGNDESAPVFARALEDPIAPVRDAALHSIACETCRTEELCVDDVVPRLVEVLESDPAVELRHKAIPVLLRFAHRDSRARAAVERAALDDRDALVREVTSLALSGQHVRARKTYERQARKRGIEAPLGESPSNDQTM